MILCPPLRILLFVSLSSLPPPPPLPHPRLQVLLYRREVGDKAFVSFRCCGVEWRCSVRFRHSRDDGIRNGQGCRSSVDEVVGGAGESRTAGRFRLRRHTAGKEMVINSSSSSVFIVISHHIDHIDPLSIVSMTTFNITVITRILC